MNQSLERVVRYLAGSDKLESVSFEELEILGDEHPFFPIGQLLLAKKLKGDPRETDYLGQVQKTALYFSNPYWLQYLLAQDDASQQITTNSDEPPAIAARAKGEANGDKTVEFVSASVDDNAPATLSRVVDAEQGEIPAKQVELQQPGLLVRPAANRDRVTVDAPGNTTTVLRPGVVQADEEMGVIARDTNEEAVHFTDEMKTSVPGPGNPDDLHFPDTADAEVTALEEEMVGAVHAPDNTTRQFLEEAANLSPGNAVEVEDEHDRMFQNIKAMLDASSEEADADTRNAVIPIDPYYTIDYFASQGIKLELDQNPQDQLGQNLKKFTQWLRHMKKLGPEDATEVINRTETEADIQQIADSSNTVREVVTEAMALVLEKQGKNQKAIELYDKLSFLNPDKRAYFADKIKKLKGT